MKSTVRVFPLVLLVSFLVSPIAAEQPEAKRVFRLWAMGCSHIDKDLQRGRRESLGEAIRQSEGRNGDGAPSFDWDIAIHLGDLSATQGYPTDEVGREVLRQFATAKKHRREDFYNLEGNHDASDPAEPVRHWYAKWVDPTGENTAISGVDPKRRPFPIEGTAERYSFRVGNLLFLMMSDHNYGGPPVGRIARHGHPGGYPAGAVTGETFDWWRRMVKENSDCVIVSAHHHMLRETTVGSGPFEGFRKRADGRWKAGYHGYFPTAVRRAPRISTSSTASRTRGLSRATWPSTRGPLPFGSAATPTRGPTP